MSGGNQHHETGVDITTAGAKFTLPLHGAEQLDIFIDGDGAADYEVRAGPSESDIKPAAVLSLSGGTDYANTGNRISAEAIEVRVTSTSLTGSETADVYVAAR